MLIVHRKTGATLLESSDASLAGADLSDRELSYADLDRADLRGARFRSADLCMASANDADVSSADFTGAGLVGFFLERSNLVDANFSFVRALCLKVPDATGTRARFESASLRRAKMQRFAARDTTFIAADLEHSVLTEADFTGADFTNARLQFADLTGANLSYATLMGADLTGACLRGADLSNATLMLANLNGADVTGARFGEASFGRTVFADCHGLEQAFDLARSMHNGPSSIDIITLRRSGRSLPREFLDGVGLTAEEARVVSQA